MNRYLYLMLLASCLSSMGSGSVDEDVSSELDRISMISRRIDHLGSEIEKSKGISESVHTSIAILAALADRADVSGVLDLGDMEGTGSIHQIQEILCKVNSLLSEGDGLDFKAIVEGGLADLVQMRTRLDREMSALQTELQRLENSRRQAVNELSFALREELAFARLSVSSFRSNGARLSLNIQQLEGKRRFINKLGSVFIRLDKPKPPCDIDRGLLDFVGQYLSGLVSTEAFALFYRQHLRAHMGECNVRSITGAVDEMVVHAISRAGSTLARNDIMLAEAAQEAKVIEEILASLESFDEEPTYGGESETVSSITF